MWINYHHYQYYYWFYSFMIIILLLFICIIIIINLVLLLLLFISSVILSSLGSSCYNSVCFSFVSHMKYFFFWCHLYLMPEIIFHVPAVLMLINSGTKWDKNWKHIYQKVTLKLYITNLREFCLDACMIIIIIHHCYNYRSQHCYYYCCLCYHYYRYHHYSSSKLVRWIKVLSLCIFIIYAIMRRVWSKRNGKGIGEEGEERSGRGRKGRKKVLRGKRKWGRGNRRKREGT